MSNTANNKFIFKSYEFDADSKQLTLHYGYDTAAFTETYHFDFDFVDYDPEQLDRAVQILFFIAGVSYYKLYAPPTIVIEQGQIDNKLSEFLGRTYQRGLGEFFYVNQLDPRTPVHFPVNSAGLPPVVGSKTTGNNKADGSLVGIGGGKDSLLTVEILRNNLDQEADNSLRLAAWSVNHRPQLTPLVKRIGLPHYWVERQWDASLLKLNAAPDTYNGHVPISAIFASVGTIVTILAGFRDNIVSNEQSANEPTLTYCDIEINHQYSKSQAFETDFQEILRHSFDDTYRYYSFLRPLSELRIAELFSQDYFDKYHDVFSSCNRAFTHDSQTMFWDGTCAKCAFIFLALTPFVPRTKLETLFSGKNLLLSPELTTTYQQLLGIEGDKPLDCVGEIKESRAAMRLAQNIYPELASYEFEIPNDYDFRALGSHSMPDSAYAALLHHLDILA